MTAILLMLGLLAIPADVTEFDLANGIHVITRTVPGGQVEGVSVFLVGGSRLLDETNQGIEAFALEAALTGSDRFPDWRWREIMDQTLAIWDASYNYDYSRYHLKCLSEDLPLLLDGFSDCLLNPQLDPVAAARVREALKASAETELQDPDSRVWIVANRGFMGEEHRYMLRPEGYPETIAGFTVEDARLWLTDRIKGGNIVITHAGPADPGALEELLNQTFGLIPEGVTSLPDVPEFSIASDTLILENQETQTAYCVVKFNGPPPGHRDRTAFITACAVIDELLWQVLRTENALTYATYAGATGTYLRNWGYMYVSTPEPARAAVLMTEVFRQVARGDVDQSLVTGIANNQRTIQGIRAQSMENQCMLLGSGYISTGDWRGQYLLQEALQNISTGEAAAALSVWADYAGWGIIADSSLIEISEIKPLPLKGE